MSSSVSQNYILKCPQPHKVQNFSRRPKSPNIPAELESASREIQQILSFIPTSTGSHNTLQIPGGKIKGPTLAPSPSFMSNVQNPRAPSQQSIPSRACNPIILNTPFMKEDGGDSSFGAELGLLAPSPPPQSRGNHIVFRKNPHFPIVQKKNKRNRSTSCPETK